MGTWPPKSGNGSGKACARVGASARLPPKPRVNDARRWARCVSSGAALWCELIDNTMPNRPSRRELMKLASAAVALSQAGAASPPAQERGRPPGAAVSVRQTAGSKRFAQEQPLQWRQASGSDAIVLDPARTYQELLGFGAAFTDSACYTFNRLAQDARQQLF